MKSIFILIFFLGCLRIVSASTLITLANIYENSEFWPYFAKLNQDYTTETGKTLSSKYIGVLIRIEEDGQAIVDFGRDGVHVLPVQKTDLVARASSLAVGEATSEFGDPNYVMAIGPRLLESFQVPSSDDSGEAPKVLVRNVKFETVRQFPYFLTIYSNGDMEHLIPLRTSLTRWADQLDAKGVYVHVIPVALPRNYDREFAVFLREAELKLPFMRTYLAGGYVEAFMQDPTQRNIPVIVLLDANGKVIQRTDANDGNVEEQFDELMQAVEELDEFTSDGESTT